MPKIKATIINAASLDEIGRLFKGASPYDGIFLDVDDTLITPQSLMFRPQGSPDFIDALKKRSPEISNFMNILGNWRLQRKVMLVDGKWPDYIALAMNKGAPVFGLTKMDTGRFGPMESVEDWRVEELKSQGIHLTSAVNEQEFIKLRVKGDHYSCFYKGVLFTSLFSKGELLHDFLDHTELTFKKIIFVDDRLDYLEDIERTCFEREIDFLGVHFHAVKGLQGIPDAQIMKLQQDYLLDNAQWLEDAEAALCLQKKASTHPFVFKKKTKNT